ncbi:MAG: zinc ribbon domain-containing protein [Bacilli bacterium]|nr:zinc ribbon domain-containing protein [Bacilli bacterium]
MQNSPARTRVTFKNREKRLFENLLICKECGNVLSLTYQKNHKYWTINCNKYSRDIIRGLCTYHFLLYDKLEKQLSEIQNKDKNKKMIIKNFLIMKVRSKNY